ncbi:MAG: hypothetical protein OEX04_14640, partial [Acidimicrobiia bacterium]|nr:hypothetical protein [Acidimicrobiia bacterium]
MFSTTSRLRAGAGFAAVAVLLALVPIGPAVADDTPLVDAPPINLTLNGVATQSSDPLGAHAGLAIDGVTDGNYANGSVSDTDLDTNAWWQVDLGEVFDIPVIKVFGRTDCCTER